MAIDDTKETCNLYNMTLEELFGRCGRFQRFFGEAVWSNMHQPPPLKGPSPYVWDREVVQEQGGKQ